MAQLLRAILRNVLLVGIVLFPSVGASQVDDDPALATGIRLFRQGDFRGSLAALQLAEASHTRGAKPDPLLVQIYLYTGLSYAVMQRTDQARRFFAKALRADPKLTLSVDRFKPSLVALFGEVRAGLHGELRVSSQVPGAAVRVDGREAGVVPVTLRLAIGSHTVEVLGPDGKLLHDSEIVIRADDRQRIAVRQGRRSLSPRGVHAERRSFWKRKRLWTWIAAAGSAAFLAASSVLWASSSNDYSQLRANYDELIAEGEVGPIEEMKSSIEVKDTARMATLTASGVLFATAVALLFFEGRAPSRQQPHFSVVGPGVAVSLSY